MQGAEPGALPLLLVLGKPQARAYATKADISKIHSLNLIEIQEAVCLLLAAVQFG